MNDAGMYGAGASSINPTAQAGTVLLTGAANTGASFATAYGVMNSSTATTTTGGLKNSTATTTTAGRLRYH